MGDTALRRIMNIALQTEKIKDQIKKFSAYIQRKRGAHRLANIYRSYMY